MGYQKGIDSEQTILFPVNLELMLGIKPPLQ